MQKTENRSPKHMDVARRMLQFFKKQKRKRRMSTTDRNVRGSALAPCSREGYALTGYARTGKCENHRNDRGSHHVCLDLQLKDGSNFCKRTRQPNWCDEKHECHGADGDCSIDTWCVCQWAFADVVNKVGCANVDIDCDATSMRARESYENKPEYAEALKCLQKKCDLKS